MKAQCSQAQRQRGLLRKLCFVPLCLLPLCLSSCEEKKPERPAKASRWDLFSPAFIQKWEEAQMLQSGGIVREDDGFTLKDGGPMTGIVFPSWLKDGMPAADYAINFEAMRVSGGDFFGSVTFPVRDENTFVTFVLGGWGGSQVGISCIDGYDASENTTGSSQRFENGKWYRVRIEVRTKEIKVSLDGRPIILTNVAGRTLNLRGGEIARCVPFGFATYGTTGRIRGCAVERLEVSR
jgi:hypothetical protein